MEITQNKRINLNLRLSEQEYNQFIEKKSIEFELSKEDLNELYNFNWENEHNEARFFIKIEYEA